MNYGSLEAESVFNRGQTIYMRTWGCTHNTSDSEYMAGQLAEAGFKVRVSHDNRGDVRVHVVKSSRFESPISEKLKKVSGPDSTHLFQFEFPFGLSSRESGVISTTH